VFARCVTFGSNTSDLGMVLVTCSKVDQMDQVAWIQAAAALRPQASCMKHFHRDDIHLIVEMHSYKDNPFRTTAT